MEILKVEPFEQIGTPIEIVKMFGEKNDYPAAIKTLKASFIGKPLERRLTP